MVYDLDRGEHPKNAGDRAYGHGDEITLEYDSGVSGAAELGAGYFVDFAGNGVVVPAGEVSDGGTGTEPAEYDGVLKNSAGVGDEVTVHLRGAQRVAETQDVWPVVDTYDGGDELIVLR